MQISRAIVILVFVGFIYPTAQGAVASSGATAIHATVDLNFAVLDDSGWTGAQLQEHVDGAREVFAQCGLDLKNIRVYPLHSPVGSVDLIKFDFTNPKSIAAVATVAQNLPRPLVFLIKSIDKASGMDTPFSRAQFIGDDIGTYPPVLLNTVWMPFYVNTPEYKSQAPYSVLAHELTHVFTLDGQHNNDPIPNLMTIAPRRTNLLTAQLCQQILSSEFVKAH